MPSIIPFLSQMPPDEEDRWLTALTEQLPEYTLMPFSQFAKNASINQTVTVAIVADPAVQQLAQFPNLVWVQSLWAGVENLVESLRERKVGIVKLSDPNLAVSMAHSVVGSCYYLQQNWQQYRHQQDLSQWKAIDSPSPEQIHVGIMGLGQLGSVAAQKLAQSGFKVRGWRKTNKSNQQNDGMQPSNNITIFSGAESLPDFMQNLNILVCLLPLTQQTKQLLNLKTLSLLPIGASVINFARGAIFNHHDLIQLLDKKHLSHAILDVFENEPLAVNSPLWRHPNITILPHISAQTNCLSAAKIAAKNIKRFFDLQILPEFINFDSGY